MRTRMKAIGVGSTGGNAVKYMAQAGLTGVDFYAVDTHAQSLEACLSVTRIQIGINTTNGFSAGNNPAVGRQAAEESRERLETVVSDADLIFVIAYIGGGTGTGAAPVIATLAQARGAAFTIGVVTLPFKFEGEQQIEQAEKGLQNLLEVADSVIVVPNQQLIMEGNLSRREAFGRSNEILRRGVQCIADIIVDSGEINVNFADVKYIMQVPGSAIIGVASATGKNRAKIAAESAVSSLSLDGTNLASASGLIVRIEAPPDFIMSELDQTMQIIQKTSADAQIIFGLCYRDELEIGDEVHMTIIATGLM